jgi:hypothetical protein
MLSPACARVAMAMNCAAWPEDVARAAAPPSRAAIRFSKTSTVGLVNVSQEAYPHFFTVCSTTSTAAERKYHV